MWINGDEKMPPYGETVMYKLATSKGVEEGICYLEKTNGNGHHFEMIANMQHNGDTKQPYINTLDGERFTVPEEKKGLFVWYNMIPLNQAGLSQTELIRQKEFELQD